VRIAFIIGNLTSRHEDARVKFINEKYSIDTLVNTLKIYLTNDKVSFDIIKRIKC
jgi:hypothetical protein